MFDFLESDWFNITLEIVFVLLVAYDVKKYMQSRKREYLVNIVLTIGFAIWALYPYYTSYAGWKEEQKVKMISACDSADNNDTKLCKCIDNATFKEFTHDEYVALDKNGTQFREFLQETKEDCLDDGWF